MISDKRVLNIWGAGQLLAFSGLDGKTDFKHGLTGRTRRDFTGLSIKLPGTCEVFFSSEKPDETFITGDCFKLIIGNKIIKGAFVDAHHLLLEGSCDVGKLSGELNVVVQKSKTLIGSADFFTNSHINKSVDTLIKERSKWLTSLNIPAGLADDSVKTLYKALSIMKTQICSPEGQLKYRWTTPDRWPHREMWLWDSVFHAIGLRHLDTELAKEALNSVFETQHENGFIPHQSSPYTSSTITQPPVLALGVNTILEKKQDLEWLRFVYPYLKKYIDWDLNNRDSDGAGLAEWFIHNDPNCRSGESGLDNSPRFDCASQLDATDFNAMLSHECELIAKFANLLGYAEEQRIWQKKHQQLNRLINERLWNDELGLYVDYDVKKEQQSTVMACSAFMPLICGAASQEQATRLKGHVYNPETFATPLAIPSIAKCEKDYYQKDMWRGPVWININWLTAYGFQRYAMHDVADHIIQQTTREIETHYIKSGVIFEFYDDRRELDPQELLRKGQCIPDSFNQAFHDFGWSATLYTDMVYSKKATISNLTV